jgi:hypothetical protein
MTPAAAQARAARRRPSGKFEEDGMSLNQGGCLCGTIRYATKAAPVQVTVCHCRFCQRATGSAYLVEPIFRKTDFEIVAGTPSTYTQNSAGSGKRVTIDFCSVCGTKLFLGFERFPEFLGLFAGTFDDPNWFERAPKFTKHIFLDFAQTGTVIPPGLNTFGQHALLNDGTPVPAHVFSAPHII